MKAIFSLSQITAVEELREGMDVFVVNALSKQSFVEQHTITRGPHVKGSGSVFVDTTQHYKDGDCGAFISVRDTNIIPNWYNKHKAFYDEEAANAYMENCKLLGIG